MYQILLAALLVGILLAVLVVRLRRSAKRAQRWMPDIRRVV
jgi:uncharacterized membrane-anchored protein YhcB (DUF1043 family)